MPSSLTIPQPGYVPGQAYLTSPEPRRPAGNHQARPPRSESQRLRAFIGNVWENFAAKKDRLWMSSNGTTARISRAWKGEAAPKGLRKAGSLAAAAVGFPLGANRLAVTKHALGRPGKGCRPRLPRLGPLAIRPGGAAPATLHCSDGPAGQGAPSGAPDRRVAAAPRSAPERAGPRARHP